MSNPADSNAKFVEQQDSATAKVRFMDWLQVVVVEKGEGRSRLEMKVADRHLRSLDILHGGVMASLLDSVMGVAVSTLAPREHYVVTVQLNVNFIRPAWPEEILVATAQTQHSGRQTAVARGEVRTADGILAGTASGTFMFLPHNKGEETFQQVEDREIIGSKAE